MGTRFCATVEAPIHEEIKRMMVDWSERDTRLIFRTLHNTGRVLRNAVSEEVVQTERRPGGCEFADIHPLVMGKRGRDALENGQRDGGLIWGSQAVGLIDDVPSCHDLLQRMMSECSASLKAGLAAFG